ncbi:MAG TPA: hypothetical protein VLB83_01155 [Candidatus Paceibacterota bacterium]|nr:hypothetical protein [Candidatus Paceibacterota bacterium]
MRSNMLAIAIALCLSSMGNPRGLFEYLPPEGSAIPLKGRGVAAEKRRADKVRRQKRARCRGSAKK